MDSSAMVTAASGDQPDLEGNLPADSWLRQLVIGSDVWWSDPDGGFSSGYYSIEGINGERIEWEDTLVSIVNSAGSSAEVFAKELSPAQPEGMWAVVDGEAGSVSAYGYASSEDEAIAVGVARFSDEVVEAYLAEGVTLQDGTQLPKAWVAATSAQQKRAVGRVRLQLDVSYKLNGVALEDMVVRLQRAAERAIGEGLLTGETAAEADEYSMDVVVVPAPLCEDELSAFMHERMESGEIGLGEIASRLVRYGLMDPVNFVEEMRERMELAKTGG